MVTGHFLFDFRDIYGNFQKTEVWSIGTTERSPSRAWQTGGGSYLLLPRRHALSSWWLWAFNHNTCENRLEEVQGAEPVLSSRHLSFKTSGRVYSSCVWSAILHASETWPVTKSCLKHLQRNDRAMIRQICNVKPQDTATIRSTELLACLGIEDLDLILKERRLRWYGHMDGSILICHPKFLRGGIKNANRRY